LPVLSVASEMYPLIKTGGLADVVGALPIALAPHGVAVRTLLPGYPDVMAGLKTPGAGPLRRCSAARARCCKANIGALELLVLDAPHLYERPGGPYGDAAAATGPTTGGASRRCRTSAAARRGLGRACRKLTP
jgi:starch synthase